MKKIVLSFDDGREDFYTNAFPLLKQYGYKATLNIITDFVGTSKLYYADKYISDYVSLDQIKEMKEYGIEIANHSSNHTNDIKYIFEGRDYIYKKLGLSNVGFASPHSFINKNNIIQYKNINTSYIRSGRNLMNDGISYMIKYIFSFFFNREHLLWNVYKDLIVKDGDKPECYYAISIDRNIPIKSIKHFISKMPDNSSTLFMFHSILKDGDFGYKKTRWYTDAIDFNELLSYLKHNNISVITNEELDEGKIG